MQVYYGRESLEVPEGYSLILGSISKFRRQVLDDLKIPYVKSRAGIKEKSIRDPDPMQLTKKLSDAKMNKIIRRDSPSKGIVICADQVAVKNGVIREKPTSQKQCYEYLESYCNSDVQLYSGICVYNTENQKRFVDCDISSIEFGDIPREVQDHLLEIGDVMYTCGGITVENPELQKCIKRIDSMDRIMGIPLQLIQRGIDYVCSDNDN